MPLTHLPTSEPERKRDRLPSYRARYTQIVVLLCVLFGSIATITSGYMINVSRSSSADNSISRCASSP